METIEGTPAQWPVMHWFEDLMNGEQYKICAETTSSARASLLAGLRQEDDWVRIQWLQSKDAEGRFVYERLS